MPEAKQKSGEMVNSRSKKSARNSASSKGNTKREVEARRDAAKAYGLLASQRNRLAQVRRTKKNPQRSKSMSALREKSFSPKMNLKSDIPRDAKDRDDHSDNATRVQAWLCETPMMSMKLGPFDENCQAAESNIHNVHDIATQTPQSSFQSPAIGTADVECQTSFSDPSPSSEETVSHMQAKDATEIRKPTPPYDQTSSCTIEENDRERPEEYEILASIQALKEMKQALLAEKHVIELKIEELKLRQEVRALRRDVKKSREELRSLVSLDEEQQEEHNHLVEFPSTNEHSSLHPIRASDRSYSTGDLDNVKDTSADLKETDRDSPHVALETGTDTVLEDGSVLYSENNSQSYSDRNLALEGGCDVGNWIEPSQLVPYYVKEECVSGSDLTEIKEYISRNSNLRSAPAVLFGALHEDDTESFIKASSYAGVEMLSVCDVESEDVMCKSFKEAIERLAGGHLDATEDERDETKNDVSTSESDIVSMSYDDEDEYIAMLESIPLDTMSNEQQEKDEEEEEEVEERDSFLESDHVIHIQERETTVETDRVLLPNVPLFPEMQQQEMSVVDSSASAVFCSPRNGRGSPHSSQRQLSESDQQIRPPLSPENDASQSDASQNARLTPSVSEALITASSCSSCWVQFSQTDRDYIELLTAKFLQAFCDPHPPAVLRSTNLPIPLRVFTSIQRDCANSHVQEAFDRAIFDTVNTRLLEIYECLGRLKAENASPDQRHVSQLPSYACLLESVQKCVFYTTDCDADPLASYVGKEHIIDRMMKHEAHQIGKAHPSASWFSPALPQ